MTNSNIKIFSTLPKKDLKDFSQTDPVCEIIDVKIMPGNETNIEGKQFFYNMYILKNSLGVKFLKCQQDFDDK